jgi:trimethylamine:corrinoid methyltransferase-like protein
MDPKNLKTFTRMPADEILETLRKTMMDPKAREALKSHGADFAGSSTDAEYAHAAVEAALGLGP